MRKVASALLADGPQRAELVSAMVLAFAKRAEETERDTGRLRAWQHLLSDLAQALGQQSADQERQVRVAADTLRRTIRMIDRNPEGRLAFRPASRRILEALRDLGGSASFKETRARSRHSESHFSNNLKPLIVHEYVEIRKSENDRRHKTLSLTARARAALSAATRAGNASTTQSDHNLVVYEPGRMLARSSSPSYPAPKLGRISSPEMCT